MHGADTSHAQRDCEHGVHTILQACGVSAWSPSHVTNMPGALLAKHTEGQALSQQQDLGLKLHAHSYEGELPGTGTGATGGPSIGSCEKEKPSGCTTCTA